MSRFSFSSLRVRLLLLVLLAVVPALGLILYTASEQRRLAAAEAKNSALQLARSFSSSQDDLIEGARQLLTVLAQIPPVRDGNTAECNMIFGGLLKKYQKYQNFVATKPNGDVFCSAVPFAKLVNLSDRPHFQAAVRTGEFAIGDYLVARVTGRAILGFSYPALDATGQLKAVLFTGLDIEWLNTLVAKTELPAGATLTVIDHKGTILARFPNPEKWVGKTMLDTPLIRMILSRTKGTAEASGMDGIPRLYGFSPLGDTRGAYVSIGIPKDVAFAAADRILARNLLALGIVGVLALVAAWFGADLFVLRRVNDLVSTTKRLSAGDLSARTELRYGKGELSELARTFDEMAGSMERLITERKQAEQRLASLHEINVATTSSLDLRAVLNVLLEKIDFFLPYPVATTVRLLNRDTGELESLASRGLNEEEWRAQENRSLSGRAKKIVETKAPLTVRNIQTDQRSYNPEIYRKYGLISYLGVPLIAKGEAIGVLGLYTKEEHEFTKEEIEFLSTLAGQAAMAIHNSQFHEQTKRQAVELQKANEDLQKKEEIQALLKELSQDITRLDVDSLLKKLTEKVREALRVDVSDVRVPEGKAWRVIGVSGIRSGQIRLEGTGTARGRSRWIIENRKPLMIPDIRQSTGFTGGETLLQTGIRGYLGAPLLSRGGDVMGILRALTYEPREFTQEQVDLLQQLANGVAVALENARLLEQTKKQAGELEKANKVKDEFLGFVSHELRTPVNALIGYAAMIQDKLLGEINLRQEKALEKIIARSRELLTMISSLLQATRIEAGAVKMERHEVALVTFLEELRLAFDVLSNKEVNLLWDYPSDLPLVQSDGEKLRHILENLINNGLKFTKKGSVKVSARVLPVSDSPISRTGEGENRRTGAVEFKVADTGIGIPKESLPTIFDMFRQVDGSQNQSSGGVGLGLHIVKKFTEMLGGKIEVESELGRGSIFTVTIPCGN